MRACGGGRAAGADPPGHTPAMAGDVDGRVVMAYAVGYLRGLIQAAERGT